jgi:hypothetical protein
MRGIWRQEAAKKGQSFLAANETIVIADRGKIALSVSL